MLETHRLFRLILYWKRLEIDTSLFILYTLRMEVHFSEDVQAKLSRLASEQGRDAEAFVREAVERPLNYDEWFVREVENGIAASDRVELIEHDEVLKLINSRYPG